MLFLCSFNYTPVGRRTRETWSEIEKRVVVTLRGQQLIAVFFPKEQFSRVLTQNFVKLIEKIPQFTVFQSM